MQTRTKSAILLLAVLALGIVIGVLASGVMVNRRMERLGRMRTGPGMAFFIEEAVRPESEEQRAQIREILDAAAPRFAQVFERTREETAALSDSVMAELSTILSDEQMDELRRHTRLRRSPRDRGREGEGRRGPPPGGLPDGPPPDRPPHDRPPPE